MILKDEREMTVRELIAELSKYPPDAEVKFEAACIVDDDEDCLIGSVEGVYSPKPGLCVLNCDGISDEDRKILDGRDADMSDDEEDDSYGDEAYDSFDEPPDAEPENE